MKKNLVNIRLHGDLGKKIGKEWELDVKSVAESSRAINFLTHGDFHRYLYEKDKSGIVYRVLINGRDFVSPTPVILTNPETILNSELIASIQDLKTIDIVPVIMGAGDNTFGILQVVLGAVLIVIGLVIPGGQFLAVAGLGLLVAGIVSLLSQPPKFQDFREIDGTTGRTSYLFNGPQNVTQEGGPVPVGYGRLIVGSQVISSAYRLSYFSSDAVNQVAGGLDDTWRPPKFTIATQPIFHRRTEYRNKVLVCGVNITAETVLTVYPGIYATHAGDREPNSGLPARGIASKFSYYGNITEVVSHVEETEIEGIGNYKRGKNRKEFMSLVKNSESKLAVTSENYVIAGSTTGVLFVVEQQIRAIKKDFRQVAKKKINVIELFNYIGNDYILVGFEALCDAYSDGDLNCPANYLRMYKLDKTTTSNIYHWDGSINGWRLYSNRQNVVFQENDGKINDGIARTFNANLGVLNGPVYAIHKVVEGGNIYFYVGGNFTGKIKKYNLNGTSNTAFDAAENLEIDGIVYAIKSLSDGNIIFGGNFIQVASATNRTKIAKMSTLGVIDTNFKTTFTDNAIEYFYFDSNLGRAVKDIAIDVNNKIYIVGNFTRGGFNPLAQSTGSVIITNREAPMPTGLYGICRLNSDGTLDTTFNSGFGITRKGSLDVSQIINHILLDETNIRIYITGEISEYNAINTSAIVRLFNKK